MNKKIAVRKYNKSIAGKIIITGLLACAAIFLSLYISKVTFRNMLATVDQLSKPNAKIQLVDDLFRDVVKLDQLQRNEVLKAQQTAYKPLVKETLHLHAMLDSLKRMSLQNKTQVARLDSVRHILDEREIYFEQYVKLRKDLVKNDTLAGQVKALSALIEKARPAIDSNTVTTTKSTKVTVDTLKVEAQKQSLWNRIFAKRKPEIQQIHKNIEEEMEVCVDTITAGGKVDSITKIGKAISRVETNRLERRTLLRARQAQLNMMGEVMISQLISILNEIEQDELAHVAQQNFRANAQVSSGVVNINTVLVIFVLGTIVLIFLIFADIAGSNRYRVQLIAAKEEAEQAGLVKQRFLANVSHELRTPLQTIIGVSEQVKEIPHPRQQDLKNIHQSSLHLLQIVNEVLDYSRIISGKYTLETKPFNMRALLNEIIEMIRVQSGRKKLNLDYEIDAVRDGRYMGDPFRLKQVLLNVLGNAVKFTDKGGVLLRVREEVHTDGISQFTFTVTDTGIGMSKEDVAVIFNEFEQAANSRKKQGTGLGLSIVKAMIDAQKGTIQVQSEAGKGTSFIIALPYRQTEEAESVVTVEPAVTGFTKHVWVVDDDPFILQLCDSILNKYGIAHTCFSSPLKALDTPFPHGLGIVFLDVRMEGMDGIALCNKLKARSGAGQPVYVALTAQALPDERQSILQTGFDALVMKPFLEQDFMSAVYRYAGDPVNDEQVPYDLSDLYKMTGANEDLLVTILQSFVTETEKDLAEVKKCHAQKDNEGLADTLHRLATRVGQVGAQDLAARLRTAEIALRDREINPATTAGIDGAYGEIAALAKAMTDILARKSELVNYNEVQMERNR